MTRFLLLLVESAFSIFAWIGISLSTIFWSTLIGLSYLVHPILDPQRRALHRLASWWGRTLVSLAPGMHCEIVGLENVPLNRPVIFMANHQSYVDVPVLFSLPFQYRWFADQGLFKIPVFGCAMRLVGYIPVRRRQIRSSIEALAHGKQYLYNGISVFLFPEGTRSHTGVLGPFQTGGFRLAFQTQVPVVPVVVVGTRQLLPRGSWVFRWGIRLKIQILSPMTPPKNRTEVHSFAKRVRERMWSAYRDLLKSCSKERPWYDRTDYES